MTKADLKKTDIFIGPIIRRASTDLVVIQLATFSEFNLQFSCRAKGTAEWIGHDVLPQCVRALPGLYFYYGRIKPDKARFPAGRVLEYSIAVTNDKREKPDYSFFETLVKEEKLAYSNHLLPSFFIQGSTQRLRALYGSCRKIHDVKGGKDDALAIGDTVLAANLENVNARPAVLCLGGDQIYADDVDKDVLNECSKLVEKISIGAKEKLPGKGLPPPGQRKDYIKTIASFTSDECENHLVLFGEYLAMYGLAWNVNNWSQQYPELAHFTDSLPRIRRLLANTPTYMIFDDHDVTDDWNLSVEWQSTVYAHVLGRRIVANALAAYWLCQSYGNDPQQYSDETFKAACEVISNKEEQPRAFDAALWRSENTELFNKWEFSTPTYPFIYFLDTRTSRGLKDPKRRDYGAPAYLKSIDAWKKTIRTLSDRLEKQQPHFPLILVATTPVFGFGAIEKAQEAISVAKGPYYLDLESWAANQEHLLIFLRLIGDKDTVILSGDVHYGFTSACKFSVFDDATTSRFPLAGLPTRGFRIVGLGPTYRYLYHAKFIQLNSSALNNYASKHKLPPISRLSGPSGMFFTEDGERVEGKYKNGQAYVRVPAVLGAKEEFVEASLEVLKPSCHIKLNINDEHNARYLAEHNIGLLTVSETEVSNSLFTSGGNRNSEHTWNFSNDSLWE